MVTLPLAGGDASNKGNEGDYFDSGSVVFSGKWKVYIAKRA